MSEIKIKTGTVRNRMDDGCLNLLRRMIARQILACPDDVRCRKGEIRWIQRHLKIEVGMRLRRLIDILDAMPLGPHRIQLKVMLEHAQQQAKGRRLERRRRGKR